MFILFSFNWWKSRTSYCDSGLTCVKGWNSAEVPPGIAKMWHYTSHTHPPHAQSQQNHSRLLWVLLSSGQEPLHQEGFSISGDRVWVWSRGPLRLYSASLAPHFTVQEQGRGLIPLAALCPCLSPSTHDTSPPFILEQHIKNCEWWATSWGIIQTCQAPPFYPCGKSGSKTQRTVYHEKDLQKAESLFLWSWHQVRRTCPYVICTGLC